MSNETSNTPMSTMLAVDILEGMDTDNEHRTVEALQFLIDTGLAYQLQGHYGRMANAAIRQGICTP